jgi:hypothetical protein
MWVSEKVKEVKVELLQDGLDRVKVVSNDEFVVDA